MTSDHTCKGPRAGGGGGWREANLTSSQWYVFNTDGILLDLMFPESVCKQDTGCQEQSELGPLVSTSDAISGGGETYSSSPWILELSDGQHWSK